MLDRQGIGMTSLRTRERMLTRLTNQGICSPQVLEAMRNVPRHIFMDEALASRAYEDTALPIGFNQTISQPFSVARMTELLSGTGKLASVLEIGTGCGYQTAVLAHIFKKVYSVERILALHKKAQMHLWDLKLTNVSLMYGDGHLGWADYAPFDAIIVTAAPVDVPQQLLVQLAIGGSMVIPVGISGKQVLQRITRSVNRYEYEDLEEVSFVPFQMGKE